MTTFRMSSRPSARDVFIRSNAASIAATRFSAVRLPVAVALGRQESTRPVGPRGRSCPDVTPPFSRQRMPDAVALPTLAGEVAPWN
jgi:hypothetical protein